MKRTISIFFLLLSVSIFRMEAQSALKSFSDKVSASMVSFSYDYATKGKVSLKGSGSAIVQNDGFVLKVDGLEVWCDGKDRWTMDPVAKEAVVESVEDSGKDYMTDPAFLLTGVEDNFKLVSSPEEVFVKGKYRMMFHLKPKVSSELKDIRLFFDDKILVSAIVSVKDGTETYFEIRDLKFDKRSSGAEFRFDEKSLDSSWVITDLR